MPKVTGRSLPLSGLFAIDKPSGAITMKLLNSVNELLASSELFLDREKQGHHRARKYNRRGRAGKVKLGQGGTLDPLASGVLVLGVNDGTKKLSDFLHGTKEYTVVGLLGSSTDSYDSEGKRVKSAPHAHVTKEKIESVLDRFRGEIKQLPPIYSALKMDGKPLYEYARQNKPLPKPIEARKCTIYNLELTGFKAGTEHDWTGSQTELSQEEKDTMNKLESLIVDAPASAGDTAREDADSVAVPQPSASTAAVEEPSEGEPQAQEQGKPPVFELKMTVSSGTYVRSIVHDIALAVGSAAHVVELVRTRQGPFALDPSASSTVTGEDSSEPLHGVIPWSVIDEGIKALKKKEDNKEEMEVDKDAMLPWEDLVVQALI